MNVLLHIIVNSKGALLSMVDNKNTLLSTVDDKTSIVPLF